MNKVVLLVLSLCFSTLAQSQNPIEVGKVINGTYTITADTLVLRKAIQSTLSDGTVISEMHIESVNKWHYLVAKGTLKNYTKTIAIELTYTINTQTYYATDGLAHKTCASAGCAMCEPFKEKGNIIGCHCKTAGTVSNECNFKTTALSPFYRHLKRYLSMQK
jgi:hypothetical protein